MTRKIGVTLSEISVERLAKIKAAAQGFEVIFTDSGSDELLECEVIFGQASKKVLSQARKLKWLHTQTAGVDRYMRPDSGLSDDVVLTNSVGAYGIGIAEHLLAAALMLMRKMPDYSRLQDAQRWEYLGEVQTLYNSLVAVVGLGDIGSNFAARCKAMGAAVRGVVRSPRAAVPPEVDTLYSVENLDEAIAQADVVALCLPETAETIHLFDRSRLAKMKKGAYILNVGRGSAIEPDALVQALKSGHLGGAGLDVTQPEPLPPGHPLWDAPNTIITPHVSGGDSLDLTLELIVNKFLRYLEDYTQGRPFARAVDRRAGY